MKKRKKSNLLKTSLAALAIALSGENCADNPVKPEITPNISRIELSKRKLTSNPLFLTLSETEKEKVNNFATKPTSLNGYYWVNSEQEWRQKSPDFSLNRLVDFDDFFLFADNFNSSNERYDLVKNGLVDFDDFFLFANEFGKEINAKPIVQKIPQLKIPQVESFIQPSTLNLQDYVTDIFNDPLTYNIIPKENGLVTKIENNGKIMIRPKGTFTGQTAFSFQINKDGTSLEDEVQVDVERNERAMLLYKEATENTYGRKWKTPPAEIYIYTAKVKEKGDSIDPSKWTGPKPTEQQINWAIQATKRLHDLTSGFFPKEPNIKIGDDATKFYHKEEGGYYTPQDGILLWRWDNNSLGTGGTATYEDGKEIKKVSVTVRTDATWPVYLHEIGDHGIGLDHPKSFTGKETIFYGGILGDLQDFSSLDKFVATSYYDE